MSMTSVSSNNTMAPLVVKKHLGGLQGTQVQSLVREVPPAVRCGQRKRKKERKKKSNLQTYKKNTNVSLSFQLQVVAYIPCVYGSAALSLVLKAHHPSFCIPHHVTFSAASCFTCHPLMTTVAMTLDSPS